MPQTNIPRCPLQILTLPKFGYHLAHSFSRKNVPFDFERAFWEAEGALPKPKGPFFRENEAQEMTPKLLALAKVCSVLWNIRDVSWHLSKHESELEKRWTFSIFYKNALCSMVRILLLFNKTWKESHQAKKVKYISKFFPESSTNVKFWQMHENIFVNLLPKYQCLQQSTTILLQCLV